MYTYIHTYIDIYIIINLFIYIYVCVCVCVCNRYTYLNSYQILCQVYVNMRMPKKLSHCNTLKIL